MAPVPNRDPQVVRTLARLARVLEHASGDLTLPQYRVLAAIDEGGERPSRLAGSLALAKPSITGVVDGLVERGLVTRTAVAGDRRAARLALTTAGRRALRTAEADMGARLEPILARCTDADAVACTLTELGTAWRAVVAERLAANR